MPATAEALQADAERRVRHSRTLGRNMRNANPTACKPDQVDPHHIVAQLDPRATEARTFLFNWGIGINDADNGVYLPRYRTSCVPSLPNAPNHQGVHTTKYYLAVTQVLFAFSDQPKEAGRAALRSIRADLIAGIFPF